MKKTPKQPRIPKPPGKHKKTLAPAQLELAIVAAYLRAQIMKYKEIGAIMFPRMGKPEPKVARLIKIAREEGYLTEVFNPDLVSAEKLDELSSLLARRQWDELQRLLQSRSRNSLKTLTVRYSGPHEASSDAERARQAVHFARNAAPDVFRLLLKCKRGLAVCWGPTLSEVASALQQYRALQAGRLGVLGVLGVPVFPTVGLPPGLQGSAREWSSTHVASNISRALTLTSDVPSLDPIPPVLSGEFAVEPKRGIIVSFLKAQPGFRAVFGSGDGEPGLLDMADGLVTGAGTNERWPRFANDAMQPEDISPDLLHELTIGDMGGVLIRGPGHNGGERFKQLRAQWTGLTLKHIKRVNENAEQSGGPGVVLCAIGHSKKDIVRELIINHRVVRHLIIDQHLAAALLDGLQKG